MHLGFSADTTRALYHVDAWSWSNLVADSGRAAIGGVVSHKLDTHLRHLAQWGTVGYLADSSFTVWLD